MSHRGLADSPLQPAPPEPARGSRAGPGKQTEALAASKQKLQKRKQITAVACQACQQRKSKCDGLRPACSACQQKNRTDCYYDMNGDQRRTAALKEKIKLLQDHGEELKEILQIVCETSDRDDAIDLVKRLQQANFRNATEILSILKTKVSGHTLDASYRRDEPIDTDCEAGSPLFSPGVPWTPSPQSPVYSIAETPWASETKWNPLSTYVPSPSETSIPMYAASSHSFQAPSTLLSSGQQSIESFCEPSTRNNSQPTNQTQNQRFTWQSKMADVTHVRCFANTTEPVSLDGTLSIDGILVPIYLVRPVSGKYKDLMSERLQLFVKQKRQMIHDGWSVEQVLGPLKLYPPVNNYNSMTDSQSMTPNVCEWVVSMMSWMNIDRHPERMAMTLLGVLFLTWAIVPTEENYQAMPAWMRPTPSQIIVPHPAWIDLIPWPEIRDFFIRYADQSHGMEVLETFVSSLSVNWNLLLSDVAVLIPNTNMFALSQSFEVYIRNLDNWSLDPAVLHVYPDLAGMAWFTPSANSSSGLDKMDGQYMFP
ncbi:uncharacterized protein BDZ99DRAFT_522054 [Mytilinidion resinicola]|uniref:Zn(2)-C6 fungal-type domain-containing protein n=1 Tax=Mytilinidion resinicola TaxID=574789 RepID=A0A6A6YI90_9PEZI|nr:uncharacterized protein BDZ99DRAFT_522054 [Mytilinidion resinicola]KAF2808511.1 hypothetical protein BDZ99DRAFT_522054 [Mytilinidion resinicola]